ncbi:DNA replication and repair protein RadC [Pseudarcicella hirudinis]|uniref:DNA replication and repair protein RadC n=1 Tax=Pseudarcicella hirudinis TaxID=1079859 RepID=A0A1I5VAR0_9BACT|nr:DNA repair protein RadC [Pseudarcicella hirudinis]SFQ04427.1 DNA replication and repair protein RadC [Pseudarcicella hirudinis]
MNYTLQPLGIKSWAEEDRPREKLLHKGKFYLSDTDLLGILIGSGTQAMTAVDIAKVILQSVDNDLNKLAKLSVKDLVRFKGIGEARAIIIVSAMELSRRRKDISPGERFKVTSSEDAYKILRPGMADLSHEEFWIILLNRANQVIKCERISSGGVSGTIADPKIIFKIAMENLASSIILSHNHPSGNIVPSEADKALTRKLKDAGDLLDIPVLDHIIFTDEKYFSFADEGIF